VPPFVRRDAAEVRRVRFDDLRHSYCSRAVRAYRIDEVRAYAGHADTTMTMRYIHFVPANDAADRLSAVVAESVPPAMPRTPDFGCHSAQLSATEVA
jgi:hypothetical protein